MSDLRFDASDFAVFADQMDAAASVLPREMQGAMQAAVSAGIGLAQGFAPVEDGTLRSSIGLVEATPLKGSYGTSLIYAWMREKGGVIRGNPWLVFQIGGQWIRTRQVTQTGSHYMARSAKALRPRLQSLFAGAIRRAMGR